MPTIQQNYMIDGSYCYKCLRNIFSLPLTSGSIRLGLEDSVRLDRQTFLIYEYYILHVIDERLPFVMNIIRRL